MWEWWNVRGVTVNENTPQRRLPASKPPSIICQALVGRDEKLARPAAKRRGAPFTTLRSGLRPPRRGVPHERYSSCVMWEWWNVRGVTVNENTPQRRLPASKPPSIICSIEVFTRGVMLEVAASLNLSFSGQCAQAAAVLGNVRGVTVNENTPQRRLPASKPPSIICQALVSHRTVIQALAVTKTLAQSKFLLGGLC
jgi:hypothetical protein